MVIEEISVHEVNRIADGLESDLNLLYETMEQQKSTKSKNKADLSQYINTYMQLIKKHNTLVSEANSYLLDHIIKYYKDSETNELSYRKLKKEVIGFLP